MFSTVPSAAAFMAGADWFPLASFEASVFRCFVHSAVLAAEGSLGPEVNQSTHLLISTPFAMERQHFRLLVCRSIDTVALQSFPASSHLYLAQSLFRSFPNRRIFVLLSVNKRVYHFFIPYIPKSPCCCQSNIPRFIPQSPN